MPETLVYIPTVKTTLARRPYCYDGNYEPFEITAHDLSNALMSADSVKAQRDYYQGLIAKVKNFLHDAAETDGELSNDLAEVADILEIELTKNVDVTFSVQDIRYSLILPLGVSAENIFEDDFRVSIEYIGEYDVQDSEDGCIQDFVSEDSY